jgi:hypothetical protein
MGLALDRPIGTGVIIDNRLVVLSVKRKNGKTGHRMLFIPIDENDFIKVDRLEAAVVSDRYANILPKLISIYNSFKEQEND